MDRFCMDGYSEDVKVMASLAKATGLLARERRSRGGLSGPSFVLSILLAMEKRGKESAGCPYLNQREIAATSGITPQSAGELVSKLEKEGLVERIPSKSDRRVMHVSLTDKGRSEAEEIHAGQLKFSEEALSCFTAKEKEQLVMLLDKLSESLKNKD